MLLVAQGDNTVCSAAVSNKDFADGDSVGVLLLAHGALVFPMVRGWLVRAIEGPSQSCMRTKLIRAGPAGMSCRLWRMSGWVVSV